MSQSMFKTRETVDKAVARGPYSGEYESVLLDDCGNNEEWTGQPFIADIYEGTSKKGKPYFSVFFNIIDHKNKEILKGSFFLNSKDDQQKFSQNSLPFDLVDSIDECKGYSENGNQINMSLKELQEVVNAMDKVTGITHQQSTTNRIWNTFRITKIHPNEGFEMFGDDND